MATLTGTKIANTYKQLLQVGSSNTGLTGTVQAVQDGGGNASPLELSQNAVNINGTFQLSGVTLTANASTLNAVADLTGATGMIAVSGGSVYGRTITGGAGVSISNADGTEGNPTIALNTTGVVSASYGPATNIEVNAVGQIVSAGAATSVSVSGVTANTFTGGTFAGTTGDFSSNVSVGGNLVLAGQFSPASLSVTGTINANKISTTDATFNNIVSAGFFVGDGSGLVNVPSAEGGTVKAITAGTGIKLTVNAAVTTTMPVSGTVAVSANQNFGTVSVSTALAVTGSALFGIVSATNIDTDELLIAGVSAATVNEVAAVSALTSVNLAAITSINAVLDSVSAATSVNSAAITSINVVVANVSALTSVNAAAITSINAVIEGNVSADSGTFNTLTVITSASIGGTLNVGGNVGIGTSSTATLLHLTNVTDRATFDGSLADFHLVMNGSGNTTGNFEGGIAFADDSSNPTAAISPVDAGTSGATSLAFGTGDITAVTERMRITSSGNVGIGTISPASALTVSDGTASGLTPFGGTELFLNSSGDNYLQFGSGTSSSPAIYFGDSADGDVGGIIYAHASNAMSFRTNGSERMRIDSSGNVGIGTSSPTQELEVAGTIRSSLSAADYSFGATTSGGGGFFIEPDDYTAANPVWEIRTNASEPLAFQMGGTERMRIDSSGNVGIGTSSPSRPLHISASDCRIRLTDSDADTISVELHNSSGSGILSTNGASSLLFQTDNAERLRIDSGGNVGIGTSSPATKLHVQDGTSSLRFRQNGTVSETLVVGPSGGDAALYLGDTVDTVRAGLYYDTSENDLQIRGYNNSTRIIIDSDGNVGIGTTAPAEKLDVNGNIRIQGGSPRLKFYETDNATKTWQLGLGAGNFLLVDDLASTIPIFVNQGAPNNSLRILSSGNVGIGTSSPAKQLHITKAAIADIGTLTDGATITPDFDANQNFSVTLGGNRTLANPSNIDAGQTGSIFVVQDGTGSRTLSFGSYWKFAGGTAPTLSTAAGSVDRIDYIVYTTTAIHAVATLNVS